MIGGASLLAGCAGTTPPPRAELSAADVAVGEAIEAEAATHAPVLLQQAQEKLSRARLAVEAERYVEARRLAEQAAVDAQLAEARARAEIASGHLRELEEGVEVLEDERVPAAPVILPQGG